MIENELNRYEEILKKQVVELERMIRHRDGIAIERSADQLDETQRAAERALAVSNLDREYSQLRNARAALVRIRDGSYGTCQQCDEDIPPKRLAAVSWAAFCLGCQETSDLNHKETFHGDTLASAA